MTTGIDFSEHRFQELHHETEHNEYVCTGCGAALMAGQADTLEFSAEILKAIAQPTRLKIIELLRDGEHCVCEIFPAIGHEQSNTSRHLQMMLKSGILSQRKDGLKIYYALRHPEVLEMVHLAERIAAREAALRAALFSRKDAS